MVSMPAPEEAGRVAPPTQLGVVYSSSPGTALHRPYPQVPAFVLSPRSCSGVQRVLSRTPTVPWRGAGPGVRSSSAENLGTGAAKSASKSPRGSGKAAACPRRDRSSELRPDGRRDGVEILCAPVSPVRPKAPSAVNGVMRCASAVVSRPKHASPQRQASGGRVCCMRED
eukprot:g7213.t1